MLPFAVTRLPASGYSLAVSAGRMGKFIATVLHNMVRQLSVAAGTVALSSNPAHGII
jgi:hypothetical protein